MTVLILGGNGYLGSKIVNSISVCDFVFCTVRTGESLNLLQESPNINIIDSSIDSVKNCITANKIDIIINTVCSYERSGINISTVIDSNLIYPASTIPYAIEHGIKRIITIDTSLPKDLNMYAQAKSMFAEIGKYYTQKISELTFINIKLENYYGEDEPKNRFLHSVISSLKNNEDVLLTEGKQHRDFIYIDDVLRAIKLLTTFTAYGYYDVPLGTGEGPTIQEVVSYLKELLHSESRLLFGAIPSRFREPDCVADMSFLQSIGFENLYTYKKGLRRII